MNICIICEREQGGRTWISCDLCKRWFHIKCVGLKKKQAEEEIINYFCNACEDDDHLTEWRKEEADEEKKELKAREYTLSLSNRNLEENVHDTSENHLIHEKMFRRSGILGSRNASDEYFCWQSNG